MPEIKTADQLRHDIDSGKTGEKVGFVDPAAAPMGTDAEAGGTPPTKAELAVETREVKKNAAQFEGRQNDGRLSFGGVPLYLIICVPLILALLLIVGVTTS